MIYYRWYDKPLNRWQSALLGGCMGILFGVLIYCAL